MIGGTSGLGEGLVRYNWLVAKLIIQLCVCRESIPNTTGKRIFLVTTSCTQNASPSTAMDMNVLPSAIKGLSSAPDTENRRSCSGVIEESE